MLQQVIFWEWQGAKDFIFQGNIFSEKKEFIQIQLFLSNAILL